MSEPERAGTTRQDESARLLAGRYRLGDVLGRGGMGTVWRAEDETLGRTVAVKELRFPSSIDEEEKRRLITRTLREAKAIARIRNNSAVTVFDVVQEDDRPWIVMELVEGKSLAEAIREDGLLEPRRAAEVGLAVLDVLRSAHREGILHRDVKPSNVLIAEDGRVVLTDFGIAQVEGDPSITSTGMLVGAPSYISPERARGHKPGPAADLWSLGGLLYAAVEGTPPYDKGSAIATLTAVMTEPLEEPGNAGPLRDVIHGLLTKDPAQRLDDATARAMLNAVINAPETKAADAEPADATKVVPLPEQPGGRGGGRRGGEEAGERLRGAMRSVRKAAASAGAAGSAAATRARPGSREAGSTGAKTTSANPADPVAPATAPTTPRAGSGAGKGNGVRPGGPAANRGTGSVRGSAPGPASGAATNPASGARKSGWPVMTPPDLPTRPAPKASLTDVVPRRTLVLIAVVVVLAVIGTVLALTLGGDDEGGAAAKDGSEQVASGQAPSAETKKDDGSEGGADDGTRTDGEAAESQDTGTGAGSGDADAEAGAGTGDSGSDDSAGTDGDASVVATHNGTQGYTIGLPEGWKYRSTDSAGDRFTGPDGQKLLIAWTSTPKDDPVADWENQERGMVRSQYKRVRIEAVDYRGWNTADWEFTYVDGGTKYRTIDRGFVVDGRVGYALMYTAKADGWSGEQRKETWKALTQSFEPTS
ncbi:MULTISPECIES: serine/threonine-protein kinase [unclassified Streptomyces]|uniref:serine/threonine-protein kinase n=1 Tax=unclassified Streptomyces TaxID=2593676 RepID=UPI0005A8BAA1|nr:MULTISPECIES: serine/threonine-protein kinase [unclassified Streptomyces]ODA71705.1 Serine/threonine-protein kinase PrkC [Streptomyces sp. AVP053U2]